MPRRTRSVLCWSVVIGLVVPLLIGTAVATLRSGSHPSLMAQAQKLPVPADGPATTVLWTDDYRALVVTHARLGASPLSAPRLAAVVDARTGARAPARPFHTVRAGHPIGWVPMLASLSPDGRWLAFVCTARGPLHGHLLSTDGRHEARFPVVGMPWQFVWARDSRHWFECSMLPGKGTGQRTRVFSHDLAAPARRPESVAMVPAYGLMGIGPNGCAVYQPNDAYPAATEAQLRTLPVFGVGRPQTSSVAHMPCRSAVQQALLSPRGDRIAWLLAEVPQVSYRYAAANLLRRWGLVRDVRLRAVLCVSRSDGSGMREIGGDTEGWPWSTTVAWLSDGRHVRLGTPKGWYVVDVG